MGINTDKSPGSWGCFLLLLLLCCYSTTYFKWTKHYYHLQYLKINCLWMGASFPVLWDVQDVSRKFTPMETEDCLNWMGGGNDIWYFFLINCFPSGGWGTIIFSLDIIRHQSYCRATFMLYELCHFASIQMALGSTTH